MINKIEVKVGNVSIGGNNPIRVQSMTNTPTNDVNSTVNQIIELYEAGSELVRFTVKDEEDAKAVPIIRKSLEEKGYNIPLIGDFHYNGHILLSNFPECAKALDKYRINPGNVGFGEKHDSNFKQIIDIAIKYDKPVRIGVNFGSLDQRLVRELMIKYKDQKTFEEIQIDAMIISAVESTKKAIEYGLPKEKIIISAKISTVNHLIELYERLSKEIDNPLHLGLTEAGLGDKGIVATTAALSVLLQKKIGDTIRVSLTPRPGSSRTEEVKIAKLILQSNGIRNFVPTVTSCPGCGRTTSSLFQKIAEEITQFLEEKSFEWNKNYPKAKNMKVAVMGCIVNGPGESKDANIGLSLPGTGEDPVSPVYIDGKHVLNLQGSDRINEFKKIIENYVIENGK